MGGILICDNLVRSQVAVDFAAGCPEVVGIGSAALMVCCPAWTWKVR
jgi:hypothetical protein